MVHSAVIPRPKCSYVSKGALCKASSSRLLWSAIPGHREGRETGSDSEEQGKLSITYLATAGKPSQMFIHTGHLREAVWK